MWVKEEVDFLYNTAGKLTKNELVEHFNYKYTKQQITNKINYHKIPCKWENSKEINHNYFKTWSYDMSYILGLFATDGYIYKNRVGIGLKESDVYLLKMILNKLESTHKLTYKKNTASYQFEIQSIDIVNDLKTLLNLKNTSTKSLTLEFPKIPDAFIPSFIRGVFDGDGCITQNKDNIFKTSICSASEMFIGGFIKNLNMLFPNYKYSVSVQCRKNELYIIEMGKEMSLVFSKYIYSTPPGDLYLIRKWEKFKILHENYQMCYISEKEKNTILDLYKSNVSFKEISKIYNSSVNNIRRLILSSL